MRVITYGTFDLFHEGHRRILQRAKALGDYLIVGVTTDGYDDSRGKLNVQQSLMERINNVQRTGLADEVIVEEYEGQKVSDIQKYDIDIFAIGSDWVGHFDYLGDYCDVVYLDRTKGVSSTQLRNESGGVVRMGVVGTGRIAARFIEEARYVSGVGVETVYSRRPAAAQEFAERFELERAVPSYPELLADASAVYIATPHGSHYDLTRQALEAGVHVLCEKPLTLTEAQARELFQLAADRGLVLQEALKTAFAPGFQRMVGVVRLGAIGTVRSVEARFSKLIGHGRELEGPDGGSISELASYPLLAIIKLLGTDYQSLSTSSFKPDDSAVELFSRIELRYPHAIAAATTGIGVKVEGDLVVGGTKGYLYVPAPWWKTEYFETRFENPADNRKYYFKFDGDGLRYELAEFCSLIRRGATESYKLRPHESIALAGMVERARRDSHIFG